MYGQAQDLPASLFDLGLSPFLNASIMLAFLMMLPAGVAKLPYCGVLSRIQEARQEGRAGEAYLVSLINMTAVALGLWHVGTACGYAVSLEQCITHLLCMFGCHFFFPPHSGGYLFVLVGAADSAPSTHNCRSDSGVVFSALAHFLHTGPGAGLGATVLRGVRRWRPLRTTDRARAASRQRLHPYVCLHHHQLRSG